MDTVSGVSVDLDVFKSKLQQLLLRHRQEDGPGGGSRGRRLSLIAPLGGGEYEALRTSLLVVSCYVCT
jgi:hypothetical protein